MIDALESTIREVVYVRNFFCIKECEVEISDFTVVIGPQASGKSVIAKCVYFMRVLVEESLREQVFISSKISDFNRKKVVEFKELFPGCEKINEEFEIRFENYYAEVLIKKSRRSKRISIQLSRKLKGIVQKVNRDSLKYIEEKEEVFEGEVDFREWDYWFSSPSRRRFYFSIPISLYVPATRSLFSSIQANVFSFLSTQKTMDPLMVKFGQFFEAYKRIVTRRSNNTYPEQSEIVEELIGGRYFREKDKDYIFTKWGAVELKDASSGQKELLPLIFSLLGFPSSRSTNQMLIVEEPEAHLFPSTQKEILELAVDSSLSRSCKMFMTTHSPYILACLNNQLHIRAKAGEELSVTAYFLDNGTVVDIFEAEDGLIDMDYIDAVSDVISEEFVAALDD